MVGARNMIASQMLPIAYCEESEIAFEFDNVQAYGGLKWRWIFMHMHGIHATRMCEDS